MKRKEKQGNLTFFKVLGKGWGGSWRNDLLVEYETRRLSRDIRRLSCYFL